MLPAGNVVKSTVKTAFCGKWLNICLGAFVLLSSFAASGLIVTVVAGISVALSIALTFVLLIFINLPLMFGAVRFYCRALWGKNENFTNIFEVFSSKKEYKRGFLTGIYLAARVTVSAAVLLLPATLANAFSNAEVYSFLGTDMPLFAPSLSVAANFLAAIGIFFVYLLNLSYYPLPFLMATNDNITLKEAIVLSKKISKKCIADFCWLCLSLVGWIILSVFVIPLVFTLPYFIGCYAVHCRFCVARYNKEQAEKHSTASFNPKF